jgi:adenylosuccinate synthase
MDIRVPQGVIGGMYGDEGKGMMTCLLAKHMISQHKQCTVVRYNSGAQAGHTVGVDGKRHVFHHFGSGALVGANTFLGARFVAHPMLFHREADQLQHLGANTEVFIDPRCQVTTPYDILINQAIEKHRGDGRHGSCGIGFGETIERAEKAGILLTVEDLLHPKKVRDVLHFIRSDYMPKRLHALGLPPECADPWRMDDQLLDRFMADAHAFMERVIMAKPAILTHSTVFEGAQGLALDEELGHFPYVTRSKTGLPYLVEICQEADIGEINISYGTRAYTTRHGAGPLEHEGMPAPPGFSDETNLPNDYQGSLRIAPLDPVRFFQLVDDDLARNHTQVQIAHGIWVSCLDQMHGACLLADGQTVKPEDLAPLLLNRSGRWSSEGWGSDLSQWNLPHR